MMKWLRYAAFVLAAAFLVLTLVNANWLAAEPKGSVKLIAQGGFPQFVPNEAALDGECSATAIEEPFHPYVENTVEGARRAFRWSTPMVEVDIAPTKDGEIALFRDEDLSCRTDGEGRVADRTMEELKALDIAHGYSADGGESFPLRGTATGKMPTLGELLMTLRGRERVLYDLGAGGAERAEVLAAKLEELGRNPVAKRDAFTGTPEAIARIRELYPDAWAWNEAAARECTADYRLIGWSGYLPQSCRGGTMLIDLDSQFTLWGWPNRLIARMEEHGGEIIVTGPGGNGFSLPEQYGEVPSTFNGYILLADAYAMTPALHSRYDNRTQEEIDASWDAMERRRNAQ